MSGTAVLLAGGWELLVFPHPEGMADHRHAGPLAHGGLVWARRMPRAMMELCGQRCWGSALRWRLWGAGPEGSKMAVSHYVTTGGGRPAPQHEDQVVGGQWLPFPGEDWLICKMAAREQERLLLTLWRVAAGGDEKGHEPSILLRLNHSRDSREQPHHLHFLGDGHGVGGAAMRRRGGGKVPARAARGRRRAAGPAQRAPWPWAGGARPSAGPTLPRGLSSSPAPFIYMLFIYLFRPRKEFEVRGGRRRGGAERGGGGGETGREREKEKEEAALRTAPGLSLPEGAGASRPGARGRGGWRRARRRRSGGGAGPAAAAGETRLSALCARAAAGYASPAACLSASPRLWFCAQPAPKPVILQNTVYSTERASGRGGEREGDGAERSPVPQPSMASGDLYEVAGAAGRGGAGRGAAEGSAGSRSRSPRSSEERRKSPREGLGWGERAGVCAGGGREGWSCSLPSLCLSFSFSLSTFHRARS